MLTAGSTFAGYRILRLLGSGGMGEVYLAAHPRLPRCDALKVMPPAISADRGFRERFNREADLAASLWHPHIVGVHDRGEHDGQLWIAMDYVEGSDADRRWRRRRGGMPRDEVIKIVTAVADALDYAHQSGLLHRDVKPANILLTEPDEANPRIMLADFGIGLRVGEVSRLTETNMAVGTLRYAAPEQLRGEPLDHRADQYALAATAHQLLADRSAARPDPAVLEPALARALAEDPADRYASCAEFAAALRAGSLALLPLAALAPAAPKPRRQFSKGFGLSAAAFLALYLIGSRDSPPPETTAAAPATTTVTASVTTKVLPPQTTTVTATPATVTVTPTTVTVTPTTIAPPPAPAPPMLGLTAGIGPTIPQGAYAIPYAMPYGTYVADIGPRGMCTYSVLDSLSRVIESGSRVIALDRPTVEIDPRASNGTFVSFGCTPWKRIAPLPANW